MTDYNTLIKLVEKYNEEALRIFNKLKNACQIARSRILRYVYYSHFERIEWNYSDENSIVIIYYNRACNIYESTTLNIPADILFDDVKIDKWIKSEIDKGTEENERQEYERLKEKFGK